MYDQVKRMRTTGHQLGENIFKLHIQQIIHIQNIQRALSISNPTNRPKAYTDNSQRKYADDKYRKTCLATLVIRETHVKTTQNTTVFKMA